MPTVSKAINIIDPRIDDSLSTYLQKNLSTGGIALIDIVHSGLPSKKPAPSPETEQCADTAPVKRQQVNPHPIFRNHLRQDGMNKGIQLCINGQRRTPGGLPARSFNVQEGFYGLIMIQPILRRQNLKLAKLG